jgi:hypothetical protein
MPSQKKSSATDTGIDADEFSSVGSFLLQYRTPKVLKIQVPKLGIIYRLLQAIIITYIVFIFVTRNQWALSKSAVGTYNSWPEAGQKASVDPSTAIYCNNVSYDYDYSEAFTMSSPQCQSHSYSEISLKIGLGEGVFFTTAYIEDRTEGWPTTQADDAAKRTQCQNDGGSVGVDGQQVECAYPSRTVYPTGVEHMTLNMEHSFKVHAAPIAPRFSRTLS